MAADPSEPGAPLPAYIFCPLTVVPTALPIVMVTIGVKLIGGGTQITGGMSGMHKARQMQYQSIDMLKRLEQSMSTSYSAINATQERLNILQKTVEANERVVVAYEEQFKNGTRQLFDLLDAYEQLYNSRLNMVRAIFAYTQATYQIQRGMGSVVESVLETKKLSEQDVQTGG